MTPAAKQVLALAETLRHWDDTLATDLNAANLFAHNVISRILLLDPELSEIPCDPERLREIAAAVRKAPS